jgi:hypothetical protein
MEYRRSTWDATVDPFRAHEDTMPRETGGSAMSDRQVDLFGNPPASAVGLSAVVAHAIPCPPPARTLLETEPADPRPMTRPPVRFGLGPSEHTEGV